MRLALPWRPDPRPPPPIDSESFDQSSMALELVIRRLEGSPRPGVLDLGAPVSSNVAFYARHGAKITFADLYRFYAPARSRHEGAKRFAELLPDTASHVDIILAWDLLNYLSLEEIEWLGTSVLEKCAPGALLFALVACPGKIPTTPSYHTITGRDTLQVETKTTTTTTFAGHSEQALLRALPNIMVTSRFQLRSSTVEYLFAWD